MPLALAILVLALVLVGTAVTFATHNTDRANRDRAVVRASQAADAGIDAAVYRLNKTLFASQAEGILGQPTAVIAETACVDVSVGEVAMVSASGGWCAMVGGTEQLDSGVEGGTPWVPASYSYWVSTAVNISVDPEDSSAELIDRQIVAIGTVGDVSKRALATVRARIGTNGNLLTFFEQIGYQTCPAEPTDASDPASGC